MQIQEKELSEAEGWVPGLRAFEWAIMRKRERRAVVNKNIEFSRTLRLNAMRTGSFKLFKRPFPGFLTILTL